MVREPEIQKLWEDNQVFKRVADRNTGVSYVGLTLLHCCSFFFIVVLGNDLKSNQVVDAWLPDRGVSFFMMAHLMQTEVYTWAML